MQVRPTPPAQEVIAMRPREAAKAIGVTERFLSDYLKSGELPSVRLGGARLILRADLVKFLQDRRTGAGVTRG